MPLIDHWRDSLLWAEGDEVTISKDEFQQALAILQAARDHCDAKADEIGEDETLAALWEALQDAGEDLG